VPQALARVTFFFVK